MDRIFQIGDFPFLLRAPAEITPPKHFLQFEHPQAKPEFVYHLSLTEQLPEPAGAAAAVRPDIQVFRTPEGESRLLGIKGQTAFYACYQETGDNQANIFLNRKKLDSLHIDPVFTSLLALERRMTERNSLIFHCAYVRYQGGAILFSAPSETGKTTQANLWERYQHSETVNGDKSLLRQINGVWTADGWPVCGTSEVCYNEQTPIHAIVMLRQEKENQVRQLGTSEAFMRIYAQTTVNSWNRDSVAKNSALIEELIAAVPIYELGCTISEEAVICLKSILYP